MDSFELNKITGAVLGALLFAMSLNVFSTLIYTPRKPAIPGYDLPAPELGGGGASDQQAQAEPLPIRLASADVGKGQNAAKKCLACHVFDKGGPNKIGPAMFGVVGRPRASHAGFAYSSAMKAKSGAWSYEDLDGFLANPKGWLPGTIMAFAGISNPKERADVLAYLKGLSDNPVPFPAPEPDAKVEPAAAPGPSQADQRPAPAMPGQRVEPGPAPIPGQVSPADAGKPAPMQQPPGQSREGPQNRPGAQNQPIGGAGGPSAGGQPGETKPAQP